ncbi:P-type ATPase (P-ATPase) Superfamily [Thraustotheca clavata]|uniref:Phospholipid-transporting ATPase n=1 Tax=Thraustotheca clavata TaxID=74557 RepID=A0A1W0A6J1_9STRA|nr:P-type ATPase (P-ATPase) Superfamily [Thraustotheca clavata]
MVSSRVVLEDGIDGEYRRIGDGIDGRRTLSGRYSLNGVMDEIKGLASRISSKRILSSVADTSIIHNMISGVNLESSNAIKTSYYTWWSFIPVFLYRTFRKMANFYFLMIGVLQMVPSISPTKGVPLQFLPLSIVVVIDAIFAAVEDHQRHQADDETNAAPCRRYNSEDGTFECIAWKDLRVGDCVELRDKEVAPADLVILATASDGICYIETKSLDGETNLKLREAVLQERFQVEIDLYGQRLGGLKFENEEPNADIHKYHGAVHVNDDPDEEDAVLPISVHNMLWRGCRVRNTERVLAFVLHAGFDTKIMQGLKPNSDKESTLDTMTNNQVFIIVFGLLILCLAGAISYTKWSSPFLPDYLGTTVDNPFVTAFFYYLTTLATVVPITLYVSITTVKAFQGYFMSRDINMYDEAHNMRMQPRNKGLNEQLGHITHIFSDKTGTITCNQMEFRKCSIRGVTYGQGTTAIGRAAVAAGRAGNVEIVIEDEPEHDRPKIPHVNFYDPRLMNDLHGASGIDQQEAVCNFFRHLALCHSVLLELKRDDLSKSPYVASSPDEQALVSGAKFFGFEFLERTPGMIAIKTPFDDKPERYEILEVFEFNSTRKRMSVIVRREGTEDIILLCKGADSMIFPRLAPANAKCRATTEQQLEAFATEGLRTLVIAAKPVPTNEWNVFHARYQQAQVMQEDHADAVEKLQDEMESNLTLLGTTAIEDRLQDEVPETIQLLSKAGIALWVLTGDMEETAINIGFACSLLNNDLERYVINSKRCPTRGSLLRYLDEIYHHVLNSSFGTRDLALVIDGASLSWLLHDGSAHSDSLHFLRVALLCRVVIACRCSPAQKAQLVELVNINCDEAKTLAIGDGANDVPMIQAAHVGIGIAGEEGRHAVNTSDFAIGQFRFLARLILVHGRWNYSRISNLIYFTYYKNLVYCLAMFWYMLNITAFSGTLIYPAFIQQGYNLFFTALPIGVYAIWDQDVSAEIALKVPQLYHTKTRELFSYTRFWQWMFAGLMDSLGVLYFLIWSGSSLTPDGESSTVLNLGDLGWTVLCLYMNVRVCMLINSWNSFVFFSIGASLAMLYGFEIAIDYVGLQDPTWMTSFPWMFGLGLPWLIQLIIVAVLLFKDYFYVAYKRTFEPTLLDLVQAAVNAKDPETIQALGELNFPHVKWLMPHLHNIHDHADVARISVTPDMTPAEEQPIYRGFAFDEPAAIVNWLFHKKSNNRRVKHRRWNTEFLQEILNSGDPVVYENQRYQPFVGFGPHLLPSDRGHWSDRSGGFNTRKEISTVTMMVDMSVEGCDEEGWVYATDFTRFPDHTCSRLFALVRRRAWVPKRS